MEVFFVEMNGSGVIFYAVSAELPYKSDGGDRRKFPKKFLKGTRISFCGRWLQFIFSPKKY